jgi:ATP-dependent 26S proteasome regulatory subunit
MARAYHRPSTIFIDEIDSLTFCAARKNEHEGVRRVSNEILVRYAHCAGAPGIMTN